MRALLQERRVAMRQALNSRPPAAAGGNDGGRLIAGGSEIVGQ